MDTAVSVAEVRQRTRAAQHATSFPLLVLAIAGLLTFARERRHL